MTTHDTTPLEAHIASSVLPCLVLQCLTSVAREPHRRSTPGTSLNNPTHVLAEVEEPCAPSSCTCSLCCALNYPFNSSILHRALAPVGYQKDCQDAPLHRHVGGNGRR